MIYFPEEPIVHLHTVATHTDRITYVTFRKWVLTPPGIFVEYIVE